MYTYEIETFDLGKIIHRMESMDATGQIRSIASMAATERMPPIPFYEWQSPNQVFRLPPRTGESVMGILQW